MLQKTWMRPTPLYAAAAAVIIVIGLASLWTFVLPGRVYAVVQKVDGGVYRMSGGKSEVVTVGEKIDIGTPVRTDGGAGAVLKLPDGASIEVHEKSDLLLESATDGLRIKLNDGSVHVTPSKQPAGNLYVQTQHGTVPVVAALFKSAVEPAARQTPQSREAFDVVSIRTRPGAGGGGAGAGGRGQGAGGAGGFGKCEGKQPQVDPARFGATNAGIYLLITYAYGVSSESSGDITARCFEAADRKLLSGGPDWIENDTFDIEANIPEGAVTYTGRTIGRGYERKEPTARLQKMLQSVLEDRFKLVLRREVKEMQVYVLTVAKGGHKLTPWKEGEFAADGQRSTYMIYNPRELPYSPKPDYGRQRVSFFYGARATTGWLAGSLSYFAKRLVVDRTGLTGDYNYQLVFAPLYPPGPGDNVGDTPIMTSPTLFSALEQELGLELKPSTEKVEVFVIERLERPTDN
jgi:uncharacterized protein (TIGR03435 family)